MQRWKIKVIVKPYEKYLEFGISKAWPEAGLRGEWGSLYSMRST